MTSEERFQDNIRVIEAALARRTNNGMELYIICKELIGHHKVRLAAPLSMQILGEAVDRYRRDNFEQQLAAVADAMKEPTNARS
jgi:hypothetical protein